MNQVDRVDFVGHQHGIHSAQLSDPWICIPLLYPASKKTLPLILLFAEIIIDKPIENSCSLGHLKDATGFLKQLS